MCVIVASENQKATDDQIRAAWEENPWGAGVAWIDRTGRTPVTKWKKGIEKVEEVIELFKTIEPPYVLHFRIPTEGLNDIELTHPFPISADAELDFEGSTTGKILFHNGGWDEWRKESHETAKSFRVKLPKGLLSDSRMLAWHAHFYGEEFFQLYKEKILVFGLNDDGTHYMSWYGRERTTGHNGYNGWYFIGDKTQSPPVGIWFSNDKWEKKLPKPAMPMKISQIKDFVRGRSGGSGHQGTFRPDGQPGSGGDSVSGRPDEQEQVEGRQEATSGTATGSGSKRLIDDPKFQQALGRIHPEDDLSIAMQLNAGKLSRRAVGFLAQSTRTH